MGIEAPAISDILSQSLTNKMDIRTLGQYPTPFWVAQALVERHFSTLDCNDFVIEPSCGPGSFLHALPPQVQAVGVEIDARIADLARAQTGRTIITGDFRSVPLNVQPTAIIGNPPFDLRVIDGFLERAHALLPEGGRVGFILPAYAFQTAVRVAGYTDRWSLMQEMIPRNIYPGLSLPLVFALFSKDKRRTLIGFALYCETADVQRMAKPYRDLLSGHGSVWTRVIEMALQQLGGEAGLSEIYAELENHRPTRTQFWREQIRKVIRQSELFICSGAGRYALKKRPATPAANTMPVQYSLCL